MTTRRQALAGLSALPMVVACSSEAAEGLLVPDSEAAPGAGPSSIHRQAMSKNRRFGSAIGYTRQGEPGGSIQNPKYTDIIKAECGIVVPENEMKWQWTRPAPDRFDFEPLDAIVRWAKENRIAVRGHTLYWARTQWFPEWLNKYDFGANPVQEAERLMTGHIRTVTERYKDTIHSWDVVNEAIDHDTNKPIETSMSRAMGSVEATLDLAFHTAREQMPKAELVYNDYMSWEPDHRKHCADVLRLLEGFRKRNVPVDTLGIQSHIEIYSIDPASGVGPYLEREWRSFLDEAVAMGYKLIVTEFDVKDKALTSDIATRDAKIAEYSQRYFEVMGEYEQLGDVLAWGMVDPFNWLQGFAPRDDKLLVRGTPYDENYEAKPLRQTLAETLAQAVPQKLA